jgi:hypothetical protein
VIRVIVEREFEEPADFGALQEREDGFAWCLDQHRVRFIRSYFSKDRKLMVCEYEAPDAEAVREIHRQTGLPYVRLWTARLFDWEAEGLGERPPSHER